MWQIIELAPQEIVQSRLIGTLFTLYSIKPNLEVLMTSKVLGSQTHVKVNQSALFLNNIYLSFIYLSNLYTLHGARTHDLEMKSRMLFCQSQPDAPLSEQYLEQNSK